VADVSPYTNVGNAAQFAGQCEAYVEQQLLGYTGVYSSAIAGIAASDFVRTGDPNVIPAGVAVVFQAAGSNDGYGHVGVSLGVGRMRSVWSSGAIEEEPIAQSRGGQPYSAAWFSHTTAGAYRQGPVPPLQRRGPRHPPQPGRPRRRPPWSYWALSGWHSPIAYNL